MKRCLASMSAMSAGRSKPSSSYTLTSFAAAISFADRNSLGFNAKTSRPRAISVPDSLGTTRTAIERGSPFRRMAEGFRYIRRNQLVLGAITLDLFAVLLGGATAMLPVYARDILQVGSEGLGHLRAAGLDVFATEPLDPADPILKLPNVVATPHVSGVAAMLVGLNGGAMHPNQVESLIVRSADDLGKPGNDDYYGAGRLNARRAVELSLK